MYKIWLWKIVIFRDVEALKGFVVRKIFKIKKNNKNT
jgi:hypothetical protein